MLDFAVLVVYDPQVMLYISKVLEDWLDCTARVHRVSFCFHLGWSSAWHRLLIASQVKLTVVKSVVATDFKPFLSPRRTSFILINKFIIFKMNNTSIGTVRPVGHGHGVQ